MVNPKITENEVIFENIDDECLDLSEKSELDEDVSETFKKFQGKNLIFRNCSKLKEIDADCLGLKGIKFEGDCSQLEHLSAYGNEINELDLTNKKQLNYLNVDDNKLQTLGIKGCENLGQLSCRNNQLTNLDLTDNTKLTYLNCANNWINQLLVKHLEQFKTLSCNDNNLLQLDLSGLVNLQFLNCSNNCFTVEVFKNHSRLNKLNLDGCISLLEIDAGENGFKEIELDNHPNLWNVSFKNNELNHLVIKNCPKLQYLTISYQGILKVENAMTVEKTLSFLKVNTEEEAFDWFNKKNTKLFNSLRIDNLEKALDHFNYLIAKKNGRTRFFIDKIIHTNFYTDVKTRQALKGMLYSKDISFYNTKNNQTDSGYASENEEENETNPQSFTIKDFPNLDKNESGVDHLTDNPLFELWRDRKIAEQLNQEIGYDSGYESEGNQKKKNNDQIITDPALLTNNKLSAGLFKKYGQDRHVTIAGGNGFCFTDTVIIDGWQAETINIGNNRLSYLVVKNCPKLRTLRYAHNMMLHDAFIDWESCPKLKPENIDKHNWDGGEGEWARLSLEKMEAGELMGNEDFNEELEHGEGTKKQAEFKKKVTEQVNNLLAKVTNNQNIHFQDFLDIFTGSSLQSVLASLDKETSTKFGEIFTTRLHHHVEELIANYEQMNKGKLADELEKILPLWDLLSPYLKNKLTRLSKGERLEIIANPKQNYWPWIIGISAISCLIIGLMIYLINKMVKKLLVTLLFSNNK